MGTVESLTGMRGRAKEGEPQGVVLHISLQEDYSGFCTQTPLETKKEAMVNQMWYWQRKEIILVYIIFVLCVVIL